MRYLIVSATKMEIEPLLSELTVKKIKEGKKVSASLGDHYIDIIITGIGMMQTAFHLGRILSKKTYDHVIQAGIGGAFDRDLKLASVVEVSSQQYADLGFPGPEKFNDVFDMGLQERDVLPYWHGKLLNRGQNLHHHKALKKVTGVSVNSISSKKKSIKAIIDKYDPDVEVMEGVALHYACLSIGVEYSEIRAISNYVEKRNKESWKIKEAVTELNRYLIDWLKE